MLKLSRQPKLTLCREFMMNMFKEFVDKLPPFKSYMNLLFKNRGFGSLNCRKSNSKVIELHELVGELFTPAKIAYCATDR